MQPSKVAGVGRMKIEGSLLSPLPPYAVVADYEARYVPKYQAVKPLEGRQSW